MGNSLIDREIAAILQRSGIPRAGLETGTEIALRSAWRLLAIVAAHFVKHVC
jgi:hypothetical protein